MHKPPRYTIYLSMYYIKIIPSKNYSSFYHKFTRIKQSWVLIFPRIQCVRFPSMFINTLIIKQPIQGNTWELIILRTSQQLTSQQNTDTIRVTSFLVKCVNVYSQQIYTPTYKNKLKLTQLKSFLPHFGLATWRQIIYALSNPSSYIHLENIK
jgi:hypothetical protein